MRKSKRARNSKKSKRNNKRTTIRKRKGGISLFRPKLNMVDYYAKFKKYKEIRKTSGDSPTVESDNILKELMDVSITPCEYTNYENCEDKKTRLYFEIMTYLGVLKRASDIEKKAAAYYTTKTLSKAKNVDNAKAKTRQTLIPDAATEEVVSE